MTLLLGGFWLPELVRLAAVLVVPGRRELDRLQVVAEPGELWGNPEHSSDVTGRICRTKPSFQSARLLDGKYYTI
jgi:hypothetical protein